MPTDEQYMQRCLQIAVCGAGYVAPNPMVGAVLVHQDRIIGEGYHAQYGMAHAEVNCLASVSEADRMLIPHSTLYVSLEPCAHFGKTPPCANRIISEGIKRVVIACKDPFEEVAGKGVELLVAAGVEVKWGVLENEAVFLNRRFFHFHQHKRPYIILKWAQSADGFMAVKGRRTAISHPITNRLVHKWRSEEAAIMVGTNTALIDDPQLSNRLYAGASPQRVVIDKHLAVPIHYNLMDNSRPTYIFNYLKNETIGHTHFVKMGEDGALLPQMLEALYERRIQSILVEGGAALLQSFLDENGWDEIRVITNQSLLLHEGTAAPRLPQLEPFETFTIATDNIAFYRK